VPDPPAPQPAITTGRGRPSSQYDQLSFLRAFNSQVTVGPAEFEEIIIIDLSQYRIEIESDRLRHGHGIRGDGRAAHQFSPFRKVSVDTGIITDATDKNP
jgi:hypothetical protein